MNYDNAIHQCRTAQERNAVNAVAQQVTRVNKYHPPVSAQELHDRLQEAIVDHQLNGAELHDVQLHGRVDVIVGGRTVMSWTPTLS